MSPNDAGSDADHADDVMRQLVEGADNPDELETLNMDSVTKKTTETGNRTVWVSRAFSRSGHRKVYHTDPDCYHKTPTHKERQLAYLGDDFSKCMRCAGEETGKPQDHRRSLRDAISTGEVDAEDFFGGGGR